MIGAAKAEAKTSMTKKYLDAVQGSIKAEIAAFNTTIPLTVETYQGEKYLEISDTVVTSLKSLITSVLGTTVHKPFWSSEDMSIKCFNNLFKEEELSHSIWDLTRPKWNN